MTTLPLATTPGPAKPAPKPALIHAALWIALVTLLVGAYLFSSSEGRSAELLGGDARDYHNLAVNLIEHGVYCIGSNPADGPSAFRTPGYPLFLSALYLVFGKAPLITRGAQLLLHGLTAWFLFLLGGRFVPQRTALLSAVLFLLYIPFWGAVLSTLSENLSIFLTVLLFYLAVRLRESPKGALPFALTAGLTGGYLLLTRAALAPFLLIPPAAILLTRGEAPWQSVVKKAALLLSACGLILTPWLWYTARTVGHPVLSLSKGMTLMTAGLQYSGRFSFKCLPKDWDLYREASADLTAKARQQIDPSSTVSPSIQTELAVDAMSERSAKLLLQQAGPLGIAKRVPAGVFWLWSTGSAVSQPVVRRLAQAQWLLGVLLVGYGFWLLRHQRTLCGVLAGAILYITVIHLIYHIEPRYSFPVRALLFIPAGVGVIGLLERIRGGHRASAPDAVGG